MYDVIMNNNLIGCKVRVKDDVDYIGGWEGVVVGDVGVGEGECVYGVMWEVEFENGECEFMMECDLDVVKEG